MAIIDAHIHFAGDTPALANLQAEFGLKFLNICVAQDAHGGWRADADLYGSLSERHPDRFAWCTSFDLPRFEDPDYIERTIQQLEQDFAVGAVACKVWKNIGMEVRHPDGHYLMVDDPYLRPIFDHLARHDRTLLAHIAEPLACWRPLETDSPHRGYYQRYPQWHMYGREDMPSHGELMDARDRLLAQHPDLRVVGAHLGSLEYDVDAVADRLDRYPNFAVDISARLADLAMQDAQKVRDFFLAYQDRILFGTDVVLRGALSALGEVEQAQAVQSLRRTYETHFAYLEGDEVVEVRGYASRGLHLPASVLEKVSRLNAQRWYPGL